MSITRHELIKKISEDTHLRPEVIDEVLYSFVDIAIDSTLKDGEFSLSNFVKISSHNVKKVTVPPSPNSADSGSRIIEHQKRLRASVSPNLRKLFKLQKQDFNDKPGVINKDTWRDALKWASKDRKNNQNSVKFVEIKAKPDANVDNPFLNDEE